MASVKIFEAGILWIFCLALQAPYRGCLKETPGFCWTKWMNKYKANEGTDLETYTRLAALEKNICFRPFAVDYARTDGKPVKEKLECTFFGCVCRDAYQEPGIRCGDYKVRFLCPCSRTQENFAYSDDFFLCNAEPPKKIRCPGRTIIQITSAYYGNVWFSRCGLGSMLASCRQESSQTFRRVSLLCNGKRTCEINQEPRDIEDRLCKNTKKILHVEYSCETVARAPGNYIGSSGEIYIDPTCRYKCTFLMGNRALCLPVCPIHYGFACSPGSVVRWTMKPDKYAKHCLCRKPICVEPERTCKVNNKVYKIGEIFELGCQEECFCLGNNNIKCMPLCEVPKIPQCRDGNTVISVVKKTKYPNCKCRVAECIKVA